jgi:prolyl-tRNA synthetase
MLFSKYFCPVLKEDPKDAQVVSHKLMLKAGMIRQTSAGIYIWLPLGLKVLDKISNIIKLEMNKTGALNVLMPTIQSADIWKESGRYDDYGKEMLRIQDRHEREMLYGPTNEEQITQIFRDNVKSYKDLPLNLYQIQWKFRDEIRPRFGLMRGREFFMKDAYSFDLTTEDAVVSYKKMFACYLKIFNTMGLKAVPVKADTGPIGGDLSHEFMILAKTGESQLFCDSRALELNMANTEINYDKDIDSIYEKYIQYYAATDEKHSEDDAQYKQSIDHIVTKRGIEIGHIFYFADKYSQAMGAQVLGKDGKTITPMMGSYGIGVSRLVAAIIEANHDEKGIIWHKSVAPFQVIINSLGSQEDVVETCENIYKFLKANNVDVLFNDKDESAGAKLATADLLGIPYQINIGTRTLKVGLMEIKNRATLNAEELHINDLEKLLNMITK